MQQLNSSMIAMARVLQGIDNCEIQGVSDELVDAVQQMRDTYWRLKGLYPEYASDQDYKIQPGSGRPGVIIVGASQPKPVVSESTTYPSVIVIQE